MRGCELGWRSRDSGGTVAGSAGAVSHWAGSLGSSWGRAVGRMEGVWGQWCEQRRAHGVWGSRPCVPAGMSPVLTKPRVPWGFSSLSRRALSPSPAPNPYARFPAFLIRQSRLSPWPTPCPEETTTPLDTSPQWKLKGRRQHHCPRRHPSAREPRVPFPVLNHPSPHFPPGSIPNSLAARPQAR